MSCPTLFGREEKIVFIVRIVQWSEKAWQEWYAMAGMVCNGSTGMQREEDYQELQGMGAHTVETADT